MEGQEGAALQLAQPPGETRRAWCPTSRGRAACSWRTGACLRSWGSRTPCPGPPWGGRSPRTLMLPCLADGVFPGGARRAGERGLPVDHHPALRLPGRELPGTCRAAVLTPWCCHRAEDKRHRPLRGAGLAQRPGRLPLPPTTGVLRGVPARPPFPQDSGRCTAGAGKRQTWKAGRAWPGSCGAPWSPTAASCNCRRFLRTQPAPAETVWPDRLPQNLCLGLETTGLVLGKAASACGLLRLAVPSLCLSPVPSATLSAYAFLGFWQAWEREARWACCLPSCCWLAF